LSVEHGTILEVENFDPDLHILHGLFYLPLPYLFKEVLFSPFITQNVDEANHSIAIQKTLDDRCSIDYPKHLYYFSQVGKNARYSIIKVKVH